MYTILIAIATFVVGFGLGLGIAFKLRRAQAKTAKELADELFRESEDQRKANVDAVVENMEKSFKGLSFDALKEFLKLAKERLGSETEAVTKELDEKKSLIDQKLGDMTSELEKVSSLVRELEKDRIGKFGELATQLKTASKGITDLTQTTNALREALASTKVRGQWGERMAEDILQLCGFIEGVSYLKQDTIGETRSRPDFTFLLPRDLKLNMDVKFPADNYFEFLKAESESERTRFCNTFLKDAKNRIKEVITRDYINPEQNTIDCVLLFIPNEQIYAFIYEHDSSILDYALKNKVIPCSPITLFAVLTVIRQAVDNFNLGQTSNEILSLLGAFKKEWDKFLEKLKLVGKRIGDAQREYNALTTTRRRQLEKHLDKIEHLRTQRGLPIAIDEDEVPLSAIEEIEGESESDLF